MDYIVKKTGYIAVKPSTTVYKTKGDKVFIENPDHAKFLLGAKVVKSMNGAPENKMHNPVENKSDEFATLSGDERFGDKAFARLKEEIIDQDEISLDELKVKYEEAFGKKPHHNAGRKSLIEKIQAAK